MLLRAELSHGWIVFECIDLKHWVIQIAIWQCVCSYIDPDKTRHLYLCVLQSGTVGRMCNMCWQTSSHHHMCWLSCAIRATDIGSTSWELSGIPCVAVLCGRVSWKDMSNVHCTAPARALRHVPVVTVRFFCGKNPPHTILYTANQNFLIPFQVLYCNVAIDSCSSDVVPQYFAPSTPFCKLSFAVGSEDVQMISQLS